MEIVGLKNFVQDDVNKLTAKFVGVKPHPLAKVMAEAIEMYNTYNRPKEESFVCFIKREPLDEYYDLYYCRCCDNFEKRPFGYVGHLCNCTESELTEYSCNDYD